ncbi:MAG: LapA family protein [bacterium]|nr:LapA family protein [bacterium]
MDMDTVDTPTADIIEATPPRSSRQFQLPWAVYILVFVLLFVASGVSYLFYLNQKEINSLKQQVLSLSQEIAKLSQQKNIVKTSRPVFDVAPPTPTPLAWITRLGQVGPLFKYKLKHPSTWKYQDDVKSLGYDCYVSSDFSYDPGGLARNPSVTGSYVCVDQLAMPTPDSEYYSNVCNQEGEIRGRGKEMCSWTKIDNHKAFKRQRTKQATDKMYTVFQIYIFDKKAAIRGQFVSDDPMLKSAVNNIVKSFEFRLP